MYNKQGDAILLWVGKTQFPPNWGLRAHVHDDFNHLLYITQGRCTFAIDGKKREVGPGTCINVAPGILHELEKTRETVCIHEIKYVVTNKRLKHDLENSMPIFYDDPFIAMLVGFIVDSENYKEDYARNYLTYYLCTLVYHITRKLNKLPEEEMQPKYIDTQSYCDVSLGIVQYIDQHYMEEVTLDTIAQQAGYNKNYLCTTFKKDSGITINAYLNYVRVRHAAEMISCTDCEIAQVCMQTGFASVSQFTKTFKKYVGIPPGEYRHAFPMGTTITAELSANQTDRNGYSLPVWAGRALSLGETLKFDPFANSTVGELTEGTKDEIKP